MAKNKINLIRKEIREWHKKGKKNLPWRKTDDLFKILISEIFLQQTNTSSVKRIFDDFFNKYRNFEDIYKSEEKTLKQDIKSLGLSNKRAKTLKRLSKKIIKTNKGKPPLKRDFLENIKGIGQYISNAYRCFGLNERTIFYDVNIKRIVERIFKKRNSSNQTAFISDKLNKLVPQNDFKTFYYALLDFGSKICIKSDPKCEICPISSYCDYFLNK